MPPSLLTSSLAREEDYRRKIDAMERSAEGGGGGSHSNGSGIEMDVVSLKSGHKQSAKPNQGEPIQPKQ